MFFGDDLHTKLSDKELVRLVKQEEKTAFNALSGRYLPIIKKTAARYTRNFGVEFEDFLQEGLLALYSAAINYNENSRASFYTYACVCINNAICTEIKRHLRHEESSTAYISDCGDCESPEDIYIKYQSLALYSRTVKQLLSDFEWRALKLYIMGYSYAQISFAIKAPVKSVDNALQRVKRKLKQSLKS